MITYTLFTTHSPEFADTATYPSRSSTLLGILRTSPHTLQQGEPAQRGRPNKLYDIVTGLFIAHNIAREVQHQKTATADGIPRLSAGEMSSTAAGPLSLSYETAAGLEPDADHWNLITLACASFR